MNGKTIYNYNVEIFRKGGLLLFKGLRLFQKLEYQVHLFIKLWIRSKPSHDSILVIQSADNEMKQGYF